MGRLKTNEERIGKKLEKKKRGGGQVFRTIGVSRGGDGYGMRFGNDWIMLKTSGQFYEVKYGVTFSKPEFQRIWEMMRPERRTYCLNRMYRETDRRKAL